MNKKCPDCNGRGYTDFGDCDTCFGDCDTCFGDGEVYVSKTMDENLQHDLQAEGHLSTESA